MLFEILQELHIFNYNRADNLLVSRVESGSFEIKDGIPLFDFVSNGQRFAIVGSDLNDGVYTYPVSILNDEKFTGRVFVLRKNPAFDRLVMQIEEYCAKNGDAAAFKTESFGGYSYTRSDDAEHGWRGVFRAQLAPFRKW